MNSLVHSFGVILPCRKRLLFSATILSWRDFFRAERYAVDSTQHCSIFLANYHRFRPLNIFGSCRVINQNVRLEGVDQLDKSEYLNYMKLHLFHAEMPQCRVHSLLFCLNIVVAYTHTQIEVYMKRNDSRHTTDLHAMSWMLTASLSCCRSCFACPRAMIPVE